MGLGVEGLRAFRPRAGSSSAFAPQPAAERAQLGLGSGVGFGGMCAPSAGAAGNGAVRGVAVAVASVKLAERRGHREVDGEIDADDYTGGWTELCRCWGRMAEGLSPCAAESLFNGVDEHFGLEPTRCRRSCFMRNSERSSFSVCFVPSLLSETVERALKAYPQPFH